LAHEFEGGHKLALTGSVPAAIHVGADELPFVDIGDGSMLKVIQVNLSEGVWVVENIFQPSFVSPTHKHTGCVYGFTVSGAWRYKEYDYVNRAGSYLYEPAGSVHTLVCLEPDTRAVFVVQGANLNLTVAGAVDSFADAETVLEGYIALCDTQGLPRPNVVMG
jgi:2,4'-dihydroxyacetophenone dioxygenase